MEIHASRNPRGVSLAMAICLSLGACSGIWNLGDLAVWVPDRAVEQGCQRETIELEERYTDESDGNVWRGTCVNAQGEEQPFEINVDPVWTPSAPGK